MLPKHDRQQAETAKRGFSILMVKKGERRAGDPRGSKPPQSVLGDAGPVRVCRVGQGPLKAFALTRGGIGEKGYKEFH